MIYLIVLCLTVQNIYISAVPVFPNNQIPGLPVSFQPGGFDWKSNLALLLQDSTNNFNPYPPQFNNQFCPCQNQGQNWNGLNKVDFNSILSNPLLQNLLGPNYNPKDFQGYQDEVKIPEQLQNYPVQPKNPSVVNNYIVIPPEAFLNSEHEVETSQHIGTPTQAFPNANRLNQMKGTRHHKQGRRRSGKRKGISATSASPVDVIDKDVEVFSDSKNSNKKESLKMRSRKSKNNQNSTLRKGKSVQPKTCEAMTMMKDNNYFPENYLTNDFNPMNFHQMFPFYTGFSPNVDVDGSQNQCYGNQMMYPDFSSFYNNPYLFNYQQLFNNPNEIVNQNLDAGNANLCDNISTVQNKNRPTKKQTPTIILNVKTVNSDVKTEVKKEKKAEMKEEGKKQAITHEAIKENISKDETEGKIKNVLSEKVTNDKEVITHEALKEDTSEDIIGKKNKSVSRSWETNTKIVQRKKEDEKTVIELPKDVKTETKNSSSSIIDPQNTIFKNEVDDLPSQKQILKENTEKITTSKAIFEDVKNIIKAEVSFDNSEKKLTTAKHRKTEEEEIFAPELGSEDEVPILHENYIIGDYYPDFRNDNKNHDISESIDLNNVMDENGHSDLSRERRKLERPLHEYNSFRQQHKPSRNYYKLDKDPALNEISTTEDPKLYKTEIETITTVKSSEASDEEIMYFITPPSLDKIDFRTKQINKKNSERLEDKETDNIKEKRVFVNSKSSTFSNAKVPNNMNYKPQTDIFKNTTPIGYVETAYGHSKVATYGRTEEIEDTLDNPIKDDYSSELSAEKPYIVMAQPVFE